MKMKGFTLIEMIIVIAVSAIVIGIGTSIFMNGNRVTTDSDVKSDLQIECQDIQQQISNNLMCSSKIYALSSEGSIQIAEDASDEEKAEILKNCKDSIKKIKEVSFIVLDPGEVKSEDESDENEIPDNIIEYKYIFRAEGSQLIMEKHKEKIYKKDKDTNEYKKEDVNETVYKNKILSNNLKSFELQPNGECGVDIKIQLDKSKWKVNQDYNVDVNVLFRNKGIVVDNC
ncbi:MAG: Tfp pilus assembly protein FimT/FimU [Clostridium sp.]